MNGARALLLLVTLLPPSLLLANNHTFPISVEEIAAQVGPLQEVEMVFVPGVEVADLDIGALRRDYPTLDVLHATDDEIRDAYLESISWISVLQLELQGIRVSTIPTIPGKRRIGFRPPGWTRSDLVPFIFKGRILGYFDRKGAGQGNAKAVARQVGDFAADKDTPALLDILRTRGHSDGLVSLGEAVAERTRQLALQWAFEIESASGRLSAIPPQTVELYGLGHFPFRILKDGGTEIAAGVIVRQPHIGRGFGFPHHDEIFEDYYGGRQMTGNGHSVDMGGVIVTYAPLAAMFGIRPGGNPRNPMDSYAWIWGHEAAAAFARGERDAIAIHLRQMLDPIREMHANAHFGRIVPARDHRHEMTEAYNRIFHGNADCGAGTLRWFQNLRHARTEALPQGCLVDLLLRKFPDVVRGNSGNSYRPVILETADQIYQTAEAHAMRTALRMTPLALPSDIPASFWDLLHRAYQSPNAAARGTAVEFMNFMTVPEGCAGFEAKIRALLAAKAPNRRDVELAVRLASRATALPLDVDVDALQTAIVTLDEAADPIAPEVMAQLPYISTQLARKIAAARARCGAALADARIPQPLTFKIRRLPD